MPFTEMTKEKREEKLIKDLNEFIDKHGLVHGNQIDAVTLRRTNNNLRSRIVQYGKKFLGTTSVYATLDTLGFKGAPYTRLHQENIKAITRDVLDEEQATTIFEQQRAYDIKEFFLNQGERAKRAIEEINSHSKNYSTKQWLSFIDTLHPKLHYKYGITLSEAIRGKPRFTDERISRDLYHLLTTKQNISSTGLLDIQPYGIPLKNAITKKPPMGVADTKIAFTGKKGFRLAKKIPDNFHKNNKEIDLGYSTISKEEVQFMLEVAKLYDPKLERLTSLKSLFGKGITGIHTGESWTSYYVDVNKVMVDSNDIFKTDFRVDIRDGTGVFIKVDPLEAYTNDPAKKEFGLIPHSLINGAWNERAANKWANGESITTKVLITNCPPEEVSKWSLGIEQQGNLKVVHSEDMKRAYNKTLELLLEEEPQFFGAVSTNYEFMDKVVSYLKPHLPKIRKWDLIRGGREPEKTLGTIAEEEIKFIFNTAKRFPDASIPYVSDFIKGDVQAVHDTSNEEKINIQTTTPFTPKADLRIQSNGSNYLIEVKKLSKIQKHHKDDIIKKYAFATNWEDGAEVTDKLLIFNSATKGLKGDKQQFKDIGFTVWNGREVKEAYEASIDAILAHQPTFFTDMNNPLPGTAAEAKQTLLRIHQDINDYGHILSRNGNRGYRQWALELLRNMNTGISKGARPNRKGRTHLNTLQNEYVIPFKKAWMLYPGTSLDFTIDDHIVFLDLETAGTNRSGEPIITNALGYHDGNEMVVHQLVARTPAEEEWVLDTYARIADNKTVVTYSGTWFDLPFLNERFIAKGMRAPHTDHIDLRKVYSKDLARRGLNYPHEKLQTYEQLELGIHRKSDIPGGNIPDLYKEYLATGNAQALIHILQHSLPDIITMGVMYQEFDKGRLLPLPQNYVQASLFNGNGKQEH